MNYELDAIDEAVARLRTRLFDLGRARAEVEWAASTSARVVRRSGGWRVGACFSVGRSRARPGAAPPRHR